jgi:hypothetical protein
MLFFHRAVPNTLREQQLHHKYQYSEKEHGKEGEGVGVA